MRPLSALLLLSAIALSACAGSGRQEEEEAASPTTDSCLANPELAATWGECNVKKTIYDHMAKLQACQAKGSTGGAPLMLKIQLKPDGHVRRVKPEAAGTKNKALEACLKRAFASIKFAAPPKGVKPVIYFPLEL